MLYGSVNWKAAIIFSTPAAHQSKYAKSISSANSRKQNQFRRANKFIISIAINQKHRIQCYTLFARFSGIYWFSFFPPEIY